MKKLLLQFLVPLFALTLSTGNAQALLETFDISTIPTGWTATANSGSVLDQWTPGQLGSADYTAATAPEHTGNAGYYLWVDFSDINPGDTSDLISPIVDVSTLTTPFVYFWLYSSYTGTGAVVYNDFNVYAWDGAAWSYMSTVNGENGGWTQYAFSLVGNTFGTDSVQLRFSAVSGGAGTGDFNNDLLLDDISIDEAQNCPWPVSPISYNVLAGSADIYWTESGSATAWEVEYGVAGFAPGTGTTVPASNDSLSLTGLSGATNYEFHVRAICAPGDTSAWSSKGSFLTPCAPYVPLYEENFDSWISTATFMLCWEEYTAGDIASGPSSIGAGNWSWDDWLNTTSSLDNAIRISLNGNTVRDWIVSPDIDLTSGGPYEVNFDAAIMNVGNNAVDAMGSDDTLFFAYSDNNGVSWNVLDSWDVTTQPSNTGDYFNYDLTGFTNLTRFAFLGHDGTVNDIESYDFMINNFRVREIPTCFEPTNIVANVVTSDSVQLGFDYTGVALGWEIEAVISGNAPGTGTVTYVTTNPAGVSGLTPVTTYDFYIRTICAAGDTSGTGVLQYITTTCAPYVPLYEENFDGWVSTATFMPCWEEYSDGDIASGPSTPGIGNWFYDDWLNVTGSADQAIRISLNGNTVRDWMMGPDFDLSGGAYELNFNAAIMNVGNNAADLMGSDDTLFLAYSNDGGLSWDVLDSWDVNNQPATAGTYYNYDLTAFTGITRFGFLAHDGLVNDIESYDFMINDFRIRTIPTCFEPTNVVANNVTSSGAEIAFDYTGAALGWEIEAVLAGGAQGSGTITVSATNPAQISGLTPETSYDFYIRTICAVGDTSAYNSVLGVTTLCAAYTLPYFEDFETVLFNTRGDFGNCWVGEQDATNLFRWEAENSSGANENSVGTGPFYDHTLGNVSGGMYLYTEASSGSNLDTAVLNSPLFDFSTATYPRLSFWYHRFGPAMGDLFVEANNGSGWVQISMLVGEQQTLGSDDWLEETINLFQYAGDTVQFRYRMVKPDPATGGGFNYESDMSLDDVTVDEAAANDVGVNSIVSPMSNGCGMATMPITVTAYNYGGADQYNVTITADLTGDFTGTYSGIIDTILADTEIEITLDSINTLVGGNVMITAYTALTGDTVFTNDTTTINAEIGNIPAALVIADQTVCNGDSATFMNTSGFNASWFDANDSLLSKEDMFTVSPTTTTNYEVEVYALAQENVGETVAPTSGFANPNQYYGITFQANSDFILDSMVVYPNGSGNITFSLYDEVLDSFLTTVTVPVSDGGTPYSAATVAVDLAVPASATNYRLLYVSGLGVTDLGRSFAAGTNFPYSTTNGEVVLTNSSTSQLGTGTTTTYYYFYDWSVSLPACSSERTAFTVNVGTSTQDTVAVTGCDSMMVAGMNQTASGFVTDSLTNGAGCDSLIVYDLTIINSSASNLAASLCFGESYLLPDNSTVDSAGTYVVTLTNLAGCDSIITTVIDMYALSNVSISGITPQVCDTAGLINVDLAPIGGTLSGNGITGTTFDPAVAGLGFTSLTYQVADSNGCDLTAIFDVEVIECIVGIRGISGIETISIYPNPYTNNLSVVFEDENSDELNITLFDALGRVITAEFVQTTTGINTINMTLPNHAAGVTFIQFERNGKTYHQNLIKK